MGDMNEFEMNVPEAWQGEADRLSGTVMVVGEADSGKSAFCRRLCKTSPWRERGAAWLDADSGQSTLGLPGTLNLAVIDAEGEGTTEPCDTYFLGATSPVGHLLQFACGVKLLHERALERGAGSVAVDTTGLLSERVGGVALKHMLFELLRPAAVVALGTSDDLEKVMAPLRKDARTNVVELPVAEGVRPKSAGERAKKRRDRLAEHFGGVKKQKVDLAEMAYYRPDRAGRGALAGIIAEDGMCAAVGAVLDFSPPSLELVVPGYSGGAAAVRFGELRVNPETGEEL
jgi:polynucleotide 5'-hydroxyl-kinase GRC3/NOL9